jgi:hypothetical protein
MRPGQQEIAKAQRAQRFNRPSTDDSQPPVQPIPQCQEQLHQPIVHDAVTIVILVITILGRVGADIGALVVTIIANGGISGRRLTLLDRTTALAVSVAIFVKVPGLEGADFHG